MVSGTIKDATKAVWVIATEETTDHGVRHADLRIPQTGSFGDATANEGRTIFLQHLILCQ